MLALRAYFARLASVFGTRMLIYSVLVQLLLKGSAQALLMSTLLPLFKNGLHIQATSLQVYTMVVMLPWSLKPLLGVLSDFTVLCGYHKRWWMLLSVVGGAGSIALSYAALSGPSSGALVVCFAGAVMQIALFDLLVEGAYSAVMREHKFVGSDMVVLVQASHVIGTALVNTFVGSLSDAGVYRVMLGILLGLLLAPLPLTWLNWLGEERVTDSTCGIEAMAVPQGREREQIWVVSGAGVAALAVTIVANAASPDYAAVLALLCAIACVLGAFSVFRKNIARLALHTVLVTISRPALGSALDYFYTADANCLPGGPHFSFRYYQTVVGIVSSIAQLLGIWLYHMTLSTLTYRRVAWIVTGLRCLGGISDMILVNRWNIALGVPDKVAYMVGEAMIEPVFVMLSYTAGVVLTAKVVPKNAESSVYAFLAGVYNFSAITARLSGVIIYDAVGVRTVPDPECNFSPLGGLVIVCNIVLPLVIGLPAALLIPDSFQNESLEEEEAGVATHAAGDVWLAEPDTDIGE